MKRLTSFAAVAALGLGLASPAFALSDDEKAAAIAILGIAALAHTERHYHNGYQPASSDSAAAFERGYRDGLHNEPYDSYHSSFDYGQGYDAGQKERSNSLSYKRRDVHGTSVPVAAINSCWAESAANFGVDKHNVHLINAGQEGSDNYYLEFATGHSHTICATNGQGQVFEIRNGRL